MNFDEKFVLWILETNIGSHTPDAPVLSIYQYLQCQECHNKHINVVFKGRLDNLIIIRTPPLPHQTF